MRDALRLMAKVFSVVFGAGAAVVVLGYMVLGGLYIYVRIERPRSYVDTITAKNEATKTPDYDALAKKYGGTTIPAPPAGFVPEATLDCSPGWAAAGCTVQVDDKDVAFIDQEHMKTAIAGWNAVRSDKK